MIPIEPDNLSKHVSIAGVASWRQRWNAVAGTSLQIAG
jgi:hypothetical protein